MNISIELVPRDKEFLAKEVQSIRQCFPQVNTINIPDLLRFDLRSWQACAWAKTVLPQAIPHIRAIDIDLAKPLAMAPYLKEHKLSEVLLIAGDPPADMSKKVFNTTSLQAIRKFQVELPEVKVYAGLDPYRQSLSAELSYARQKLEAGASGFFSQPFFDLRLLEIYAERLEQTTVYWGLTSVTTQRSLSYWRNRNKVVFPASFEPNLAWSRAFAKDALAFAKTHGTNLYFMPIRVDVVSFLEGLL